MTNVDILEVTLRDGSYLIDFQFTAEDTAVIAAALQAVGFRWIEVGHGVGMNGGSSVSPAPAASDEEYLEAAASVLDKAHWGMFFIPGIGRPEDLRLAARYGMKFVRIGTNVTQSEQARPSIELAKELGMTVSYNAMKSYAVTPAEFARRAGEVRSWGADVACLVDSAGSFDGDTIAAYIRATRDATDVDIGFHGHDNLSMAVANSLRAIEEGARLVDASLQGMGRSAGNAITEVLTGILQQRGLMQHIDLKGTMDVGSALIQPLLGRRGVDSLAVTAGLARFHSSFMPKVVGYARRHHVDVRDLIVRLCQEDQVSAPDELLEELSRDLAAQKMSRVVNIPAYVRAEGSARGAEALRTLVKNLRSRGIKSGKYSALNVVRANDGRDECSVSRNIQATAAHILGVVTVRTPAQLDDVLRAADGVTDLVLLDVDPYPNFDRVRPHLEKSKLLTYRDSRVWVDAVEDQVVRLLGEWLQDVRIVVAGDHPKSRRVALRLSERGAAVTLVGGQHALQELAMAGGDGVRYAHATANAIDAGVRLVIAWPERDALTPEDVANVGEGCFVLDAAIGGLSAEAQETARARGAQLVRVDVWPQLGAALEAAHESSRIREEALGWGELAGIGVVSGGAIGRPGDLIVDSVQEPTRVIGIADGRGGVIFEARSDEDTRRMRIVREEIYRRLLEPRLPANA